MIVLIALGAAGLIFSNHAQLGDICFPFLTKMSRDRPYKKRLMLRAFAEHGTVEKAATLAKISRRTHSRWLGADPNYRQGFQQAKQSYIEKLEEEADRRALEGRPRLKFFKGELIVIPCQPNDPLGKCIGQSSDGQDVWVKPYVEFEMSDNLLMFRLKRLDPLYRDHLSITTNPKRRAPSRPADPKAIYSTVLARITQKKT